MRNKENDAAKSNVTEKNLEGTLYLKDNPSLEALRNTDSPVSKIVSRFQ